jgi:hypothetical protein
MAGTPIIINVTGGLQDQAGFTQDGVLLTPDDYIELGSLHDWRQWEDKLNCGSWARPVWSRSRSLAGSVPTPYIWDDRVDLEEVAQAILEMYETPKEERKANGLEGREAFIGDMGLSHTNMINTMSEGIDTTLANWKPRDRFDVFKIK